MVIIPAKQFNSIMEELEELDDIKRYDAAKKKKQTFTDAKTVFKQIETRKWMQGWDGTINGKPAATGTYVWMIKGIDTNGGVVELMGTVILIR